MYVCSLSTPASGFRLATLLLVALIGGFGPRSLAAAPPPLDPSAFLTVETGTLPVVLSAPHGGTLALPGLAERTTGVTTLDIHTSELSAAIQAKLVSMTGRQAHRVAALASRKYVDFNRASDQAYESPALAPVHQAYHAALGRAVVAARTQGGKAAILVDLHGQGADSAQVFRGTRDGTTSDLRTLLAPNGFLHALSANGVQLGPVSTEQPESHHYDGGYIVATYGLGAPEGIPAVQLEFGNAYRKTPWNIDATAQKVAQAIVAHLKANGAL